MKCEQVKEHLLDYLYGELPPELNETVERALGECPECAAELAELQQVRRAAGSLPALEVPPRVHNDIMRAARLQADEYAKAKRPAFSWSAFFASPALASALVIGLVLGVGYMLTQQAGGGLGVEQMEAGTESAEPTAVAAADRGETPEAETPANVAEPEVQTDTATVVAATIEEELEAEESENTLFEEVPNVPMDGNWGTNAMQPPTEGLGNTRASGDAHLDSVNEVVGGSAGLRRDEGRLDDDRRSASAGEGDDMAQLQLEARTTAEQQAETSRSAERERERERERAEEERSHEEREQRAERRSRSREVATTRSGSSESALSDPFSDRSNNTTAPSGSAASSETREPARPAAQPNTGTEADEDGDGSAERTAEWNYGGSTDPIPPPAVEDTVVDESDRESDELLAQARGSRPRGDTADGEPDDDASAWDSDDSDMPFERQFYGDYDQESAGGDTTGDVGGEARNRDNAGPSPLATATPTTEAPAQEPTPQPGMVTAAEPEPDPAPEAEPEPEAVEVG